MTEQTACRRCGAPMGQGVALAQTYTGSPDDLGGDVVTLSPGGPGQMASCRKCPACGWSVAGAAPQENADGVMFTPGRVVWHSSDENSPSPDVGISVGLGGAMLFAGEISDPDGVCSWGLAIYQQLNDSATIARSVEREASLSLVERIGAMWPYSAAQAHPGDANKMGVARLNHADHQTHGADQLADDPISFVTSQFDTVLTHPAQEVDPVEARTSYAKEAIIHAVHSLMSHLEAFHDSEVESREAGNLRSIMHHLQGTLIGMEETTTLGAQNAPQEAQPVASGTMLPYGSVILGTGSKFSQRGGQGVPVQSSAGPVIRRRSDAIVELPECPAVPACTRPKRTLEDKG